MNLFPSLFPHAARIERRTPLLTLERERSAGPAMSRNLAPVALGLLALLATERPAFAAPELYEYRIVHASHGEIGRYANIVDRRGNDTEVRTELHIAVTILGITAYRQDAERVERWQGARLTSFDGTTVTNGERLQVHGEAQGGGFAVTTPTGTAMAPASSIPPIPGRRWC